MATSSRGHLGLGALGLCFVLSSVGCGGVDATHAMPAGAGTGAVAGGENHVAEPGGTGGTAVAGDTSSPMTGIGGSNGAALPTCQSSPVAANTSANVRDPDGAFSAVAAHAKVTVMSVQQTHLYGYGADLVPGLLNRQYLLQADSQQWNLSVTSPNLTDDLIRQGDVLDFELTISVGSVPLAPPLKDQTFALSANGKPLLFAANLKGYAPPIPAFPIPGLSVSDMGASCSTPPSGSCGLSGHLALLTLGNASATVETGQVAQLGDFSVAVPVFGTATSNGFCDDSGATTIIGVNVGAPNR
ncbi:MAG TPA: hypothetical protein VNG33_17025 [Polyangiaceae bacterium]|nr:hypothetical protein [Polyangiaceae bacterium]